MPLGLQRISACAIISAWLVHVSGCASDLNSNNQETYNKLVHWGSALNNAVEAKFDFTTFEKVRDLGAALRKHRYAVDTPRDEEFEVDAWRREMRVEHSKDGDAFVTKIISVGRNGKRDLHDGDDLFVEIRYTHDKANTEVTLSTIDGRGRRITRTSIPALDWRLKEGNEHGLLPFDGKLLKRAAPVQK